MSGVKTVKTAARSKKTGVQSPVAGAPESKAAPAKTAEPKKPLYFSFEGFDAMGRAISGDAPFETEVEAQTYLEVAGIKITKLEAVYQQWYQLQLFDKMPTRIQYAQLAKNLATALEMGQSPFQVCSRFSKSNSNKILKAALAEVSYRLERGQSWDIAFGDVVTKRGKPVFPITFIYALRIAEKIGNFQLLRNFAEAQIKADAIIKKVISAMIYPVCVMVAVFIAFVVEVYWVMPMFGEIFKGMLAGKDDKLPFLTQFMLDLSSFFTSPLGVFALIAFVAAVFGLYYLLFVNPKGIEWRERKLLKVWKFGAFYKNYHGAVFCRNLSMLWEGETNVKKRFEVIAQTSTNPVFREMGEHIEQLLNDNPPDLQYVFTAHYDLLETDFQAVAGQLGSEGGDGAVALQDYALILEDRAQERLDATIAVVQQISILVPAAFVVLLLLASYMPLFELVGRIAGK